MHLGNGAITPECVALTYSAAATGLGGCVLLSKTQWRTVSAEKRQLAFGLGCAVFAAQALNVPVAAGTSAHLVGGVLLAWMLGPALGAWSMAIVLAIQALALGDGGIAALGANVLNMALVPAGLVAAMQSLGTRVVGTARPSAVGMTSALAVVVAAGLIVVETALFRSAGELAGWSEFVARMIGYHLWIGAIEGVATIAILYAANAALIPWPKFQFRLISLGLAAVVVLAAILLPISSSLPDGYEAAAQASGMGWLLGR